MLPLIPFPMSLRGRRLPAPMLFRGPSEAAQRPHKLEIAHLHCTERSAVQVSGLHPRNDINLKIFFLAMFFQVFHNIAYTLRLVRLAHQQDIVCIHDDHIIHADGHNETFAARAIH
jgi:hypothetical protein